MLSLERQDRVRGRKGERKASAQDIGIRYGKNRRFDTISHCISKEFGGRLP